MTTDSADKMWWTLYSTPKDQIEAMSLVANARIYFREGSHEVGKKYLAAAHDLMAKNQRIDTKREV